MNTKRDKMGHMFERRWWSSDEGRESAAAGRISRCQGQEVRDRRGDVLRRSRGAGSKTARAAGCATAASRPTRLDVVRVPGCFELPVAARRLIRSAADYDGLVALGVVVRGDTPHFDYVAGECARGIMDVQIATGVPIGFGVLTTENLAQAEERADPARGDKGYDAGDRGRHGRGDRGQREGASGFR